MFFPAASAHPAVVGQLAVVGSEPVVQRQGLKQIVVQLPGVKDPKRAKDLIKETALLEFKMLDEDSQLRLELPASIPRDKEAEIISQFEGKLPEGDQILFERSIEKETGREYRIPYVVKKRVMLTGSSLILCTRMLAN